MTGARSFSVVAVLIFAGLALGQRAGGFREVPVTDKDVVAAAKYAVGARKNTTLVKLVQAEAQVVAGRNYRLTMDVRVDDAAARAVAIVWAKLDGTYELTRWSLAAPAGSALPKATGPRTH